MKQQQPQSTTPEGISIISTTTTAKTQDERTETPMMLTSTLENKVSNQESSKTYDRSTTEVSQRLQTSIASTISDNDHKETPEVNEETTEMNYELPATPETNHESPEPVQETQESNQEVSEENEEKSSSTESEISTIQIPQQSTQASVTEVSDDQKTTEPTVDSVVDKIHGIVKTTTSPFSEDSDENESKGVDISIEKKEKIEDEKEEIR